jgi:hypothetical protein
VDLMALRAERIDEVGSDVASATRDQHAHRPIVTDRDERGSRRRTVDSLARCRRSASYESSRA